MKNISAALAKAQAGFAPALKTSTNPHFKSRYADLSACIEAVIDSLNANGIALVQLTHPCENGVIVETTFIHESGESLSCGQLHVPAIKNDPQSYGSALTYARRYSLMAACGIAPEDDDGNAAARQKKPVGVPKSLVDEHVEAIGLAHSKADLILAYNTAMEEVGHDPDARASIEAAKESRIAAAKAKADAKAQAEEAEV